MCGGAALLPIRFPGLGVVAALLPSRFPRYKVSGMWRNILSFGDVSSCCGDLFVRGMGYLVGEGHQVLFGIDDLLGMGPLCSSFPRLFRIVVTKSSLVKDCCFRCWFGVLNSLANVLFCREEPDRHI